VKRPVERIVAELGLPGLVDALAQRLSGADFTTLMLDVMQRRAAAIAPATLRQRYAADRFVAPSAVPLRRLRQVEDALIDACSDDFEAIVLAPLTPLGTHSAVATVSQNKIVATLRNSEVAADPTNALALEASMRRRAALARNPKSHAWVALAALQRVVRAQHVSGGGRFAHFGLLGLVSAGRDTGNLAFECAAAAAHLGAHARGLLALGADAIEVSLTDFSGGRYQRVVAASRAALAHLPRVSCVDDPNRASGDGYYTGFCFKLHAAFPGSERIETSDGGIVDWCQRLVGSAKERCFISGLGIDRVAIALPNRFDGETK
jgi:hypothetical protein